MVHARKLTVRRSYGKPGKDRTTDGAADEHRGTKAKGPDGDRRGRRTYPPRSRPRSCAPAASTTPTPTP